MQKALPLPDMSAVYELLARIDGDLAQEEAKFYEFKEQYGHNDEAIRERYNRHVMSVKPLRDYKDHIIKRIAAVKTLESPPPILISRPS